MATDDRERSGRKTAREVMRDRVARQDAERPPAGGLDRQVRREDAPSKGGDDDADG